MEQPPYSKADLLHKLRPDSIMTTLMRAACLLTGWEMIASEIVSRVRDFYLIGFDESGLLYTDDYQKVKERNKSLYKASVSWLLDMNALTTTQVATLLELRDHRNKVAHELTAILTDPRYDVRVDLLLAAREILDAIGKFFGQIEVDGDPGLDGMEVNLEGIKSMSSVLFDYLVDLTTRVADQAIQSMDEAPDEA